MGGACQSATVHHSQKPETSRHRHPRTRVTQRLDDANDTYGSFRDTAFIENFFAAAYKMANREEALTNILVCDASRAHFIMFLEKVYYADRISELEVLRKLLV
jgi:hypothetical protein